ncbi:MAG: hypothetical protein D6723_09975 [Acidobacteria bacterium]|nr:MAG: hypothetical protein D6723_09975 [Acidobacteriota bacterium]
MPWLILKPTEGPVGTDVLARGTGFRPNVSLRLQFEDQRLKSITTDNRGSFVLRFEVPVMPYGERDVIAISQTAHMEARATFKIQPRITQVEPVEASPGDTITIRGNGFGSEEPIEVRVNGQTIDGDLDARTHPDGTFVITLKATENLFPPTPVVVTVIGKTTGASAQSERKIEVKPSS